MMSSGSDLLTVVLEDYFQVASMRGVVPREQWYRFESRLERNTLKTLDLLEETGSRATFFTLGWIADEMPELLAEVVSRGHEIATKGYFHRGFDQFDRSEPAEFCEDLSRSRAAIELASGQRLAGFRVAHGRLREQNLWALDVLQSLGFDYDSSFRPPSFRPLLRSLGRERPQRFPHQRTTAAGEIWEFPLSSVNVGGFLVPMSGGNYHRQLPDFWTRWAVERWHRRYDSPFLMYFHVWDLDPEQPRIKAAPLKQRIRQYRNLDKMEGTIRSLLSRYPFGSIADYLGLDLQLEREPEGCRGASEARGGSSAAAPPRPHEVRQGAPRTALSIVVPCYNEDDVLGYLANTLTSVKGALEDSYDLSWIFVDDGSRDDTWQNLERVFGDWPGVQLVRHPQNRGVAAAVATGIEAAQTELVASIDADCTYDPHQLRGLLELMVDGVAMVTASPYHPDGEAVNVSPRRLFLSRTLSRMYGLALGTELATYTSCFRVYRRSIVRRVSLREEGFLGVAELLGKLLLEGQTVVEAPAVLESRLLGSSKMKILRTAFGHLRLLGRLVMKRWSSASSR